MTTPTEELPPIALRELAALPYWLSAFVPAPSAAWSARFATLVAQSAPALSCALLPEEAERVAEIVRLRLQLDLAGVEADSRADAALDTWLVARVIQSASWSTPQRRAWWQIERLALIVDALDRWTRRYFLDEPPARGEGRLRDVGTYWLDIAEESWNWGEDVHALFAQRISENLLDCAWAAGHRQLRSLRRGSRPGAGASRSGASGSPRAEDDPATSKPSDGDSNDR